MSRGPLPDLSRTNTGVVGKVLVWILYLKRPPQCIKRWLQRHKTEIRATQPVCYNTLPFISGSPSLISRNPSPLASPPILYSNFNPRLPPPEFLFHYTLTKHIHWYRLSTISRKSTRLHIHINGPRNEAILMTVQTHVNSLFKPHTPIPSACVTLHDWRSPARLPDRRP